jgi:hypothetical protein
MPKRTQKKILSKVANIQTSLDVIAHAVKKRILQREISRRDAEAESARRAKAERRLAYVHMANRCGMDSDGLRIAISEVARQRGEFPSPSLITVLRWKQIINSDGTLPFPASENSRQGLRKTDIHRFYEE